ncbi:AgmX/PglI C-terminal domain-containing protein [Melittangium boletus]|uniref:AgmX/PglI C-terminal domain-containing protein n=1 Tax=Melittangium boletus TaxID=83453 RepID=UPI003DA52133
MLLASTACGTRAATRHAQIESNKQRLSLSTDPKEQSALLFRQGALYWEESRSSFVAASQKDVQLLEDARRGDTEAKNRDNTTKTELLSRARTYRTLAIEQYTKLVMNYPDFERSDEALFILGSLFMEAEQDREALAAFKRLLERYPRSRHVPDTFFALGEYLFNNAQGQRDGLEKALSAYKRAAESTDNPVHLLALYKQGWCFFKLGDYPNAKEQWKTVARLGEQASASVGATNTPWYRAALVREARAHYVRAYARDGDVSRIQEDFSTVSTQPEARFTMMKELADLYFQQGKEREAVITLHALLKTQPLSPEAPRLQARITQLEAALQTAPTAESSGEAHARDLPTPEPRDKAMILAVIKAYKGKIRDCYDVASIRRVGLEGRVVMRFAIRPEGFVRASEIVQSTVRSAELESCIDEHVKGFVFPESRGRDVVTYPFLFAVRGTPGAEAKTSPEEVQPAME